MTGSDPQTEYIDGESTSRKRQFAAMLDELSVHGFQLNRVRLVTPDGHGGAHYELLGRRDGTVFWQGPFRRGGQILDFDDALDQRPVDLVLFDMEPAQVLSYLQTRLDVPADLKEPVHVYLDRQSCLHAVRRRLMANNSSEPRAFDVLYARNDAGIALMFVHRDPSGPYQARVEDLRDDAPWVPVALLGDSECDS